MAWIELKESQKIEQRWDGGYMWRHFLALWTDINASNSSFDRYYWIGQSLAQDPETVWPSSHFLASLRICNIVITPHPQRAGTIMIDLEYSTKQDKTTYEASPDCVESHNITMDCGTYNVSTEDQYISFAGLQKSWADKFLDTSASAIVPSLNIFRPQSDIAVSAYASKFMPKRVLQKTGRINSVKFLGPYLSAIAAATEISIENMSDFDDTEAWMLVGANVRRARVDSWQYQYIMRWSEWGPKTSVLKGGWNRPYNINADLYYTLDFMGLFDDMWGLSVPGIIHGNR